MTNELIAEGGAATWSHLWSAHNFPVGSYYAASKFQPYNYLTVQSC
jgi:hypothetical protein